VQEQSLSFLMHPLEDVKSNISTTGTAGAAKPNHTAELAARATSAPAPPSLCPLPIPTVHLSRCPRRAAVGAISADRRARAASLVTVSPTFNFLAIDQFKELTLPQAAPSTVGAESPMITARPVATRCSELARALPARLWL
jgi:hypothetical protein